MRGGDDFCQLGARSRSLWAGGPRELQLGPVRQRRPHAARPTRLSLIFANSIKRESARRRRRLFIVSIALRQAHKFPPQTLGFAHELAHNSASLDLMFHLERLRDSSESPSSKSI